MDKNKMITIIPEKTKSIIIKAFIENIFFIPDIINSNIYKYNEMIDEFDIN